MKKFRQKNKNEKNICEPVIYTMKKLILCILLFTGCATTKTEIPVSSLESNDSQSLQTVEEAQLESKQVEEPKLETYTNSIGMEFIQIPAGEFLMGCSEENTNCSDSTKPVHKVKITKPFYMGKYEVTQKQWLKVMGKNPSKFKGCEDCPVEQVSWEDVKKFIKKLNVISASANEKKKYRLPTEAEWEYAARAESTTIYYWGNEMDRGYAWSFENSESTHPVGQMKPNSFGLYDMMGNVWEWCEDWYEQNYYKNSPTSNPLGPTSGKYRVIRGGAWAYGYKVLHSSYHFIAYPSERDYSIGFRLILQ